MVARGLAGLLNDGKTFPNLVGKEELGNTGFRELGTGSLMDVVPWAIVLMVIFAVAAWFVTSRTPFGRAVYAVGGNEEAARISGINVDRLKMTTFVVSSVLAAVSGIILVSRMNSGQPNAGMMYELDAIAAVVVGGTSLSGGRGSIAGTFLGAMLIAVLRNGLNLLNVNSYVQQVVVGVVILLAALLDRLRRRP